MTYSADQQSSGNLLIGLSKKCEILYLFMAVFSGVI